MLLAGCQHDAGIIAGPQSGDTAATTSPVADAAQKIDERIVRAAAVNADDEASADVPVDEHGRLQVYVRCALGDAEQQRQALQAAGLTISAQADVGASRLVEGWVEPEHLQALASLDFVQRISPPRKGQPRSQVRDRKAGGEP
ncbi:MAG: hypothetical protein ACLGI7_10005 [Gammaproteobacteria bacterium]